MAGGHYREPNRLKPIAAGINDARNPTLLLPGQTPSARNVEFDRDSVLAARGALKFGNQPAPLSGVRTKVDPGLSPLSYEPGLSVPLRGYCYFPYSRQYDLCGDFVDSGSEFLTRTYHARRGRSFGFKINVRWPEDVRQNGVRNGLASGAALFETLSGAQQADVTAIALAGGYDEALEECTGIVQQGGDRLSPMAWCLAVVNTGERFEYVSGASPFTRPNNYALAFMWLDAAQWGFQPQFAMRYKLGTGPQPGVGSTGIGCTQAYRAIIVPQSIEPGRQYNVAVDLSLDSGTAGLAGENDPTASWNGDGTFAICVREDDGRQTTYKNFGTDMFVWKGPSDSYDYLVRYGIRFSGRLPFFAGLGYRFCPHNKLAFVPFGIDSAALEKGGFQMLDISNHLPPAGYTMTCSHAAGAAELEVLQQGLAGGHAAEQNPLAPTATPWDGLDLANGANPEALRNYWAVMWQNATSPQLSGARFKLGAYSEPGALQFDAGLDGLAAAWTAQGFVTVAFRWSQVELEIDDFRIYTQPRDYSQARRAFSLRSEALLDDETEPDLECLAARWSMCDAEGGTLRNTVVGPSGFFAPFALPADERGSRGKNRVFLSGEGECLQLDLSKDPIVLRELANARTELGTAAAAFAVEITIELPEAYYAIDESILGGLWRQGKYAPWLIAWDVARAENEGYASELQPLMRFGHKIRLPFAIGSEPFLYPMGFSLEVAGARDNRSELPHIAVPAWDAGTPNTSRWDVSAPWVGKTITFQIGFQSRRTGNPEEFRAYVACSPKDALLPGMGDAPNAEFAYFADVDIHARDIMRSIITIGGAWQPGGDGYSTLNARVIVDEVRVFATPGPGLLPLQSGSATARDGKLSGARSLPPHELTAEEILLPVGGADPNVNATQNARTLEVAGATRFYESNPEDSLRAIKECPVLVSGDSYVRRTEGLPTTHAEWYYVASLQSNAREAVIGTPFNDGTRKNSRARAFRLLGYTAFADDISRKALSLGQGSAFIPAASTVDDAVVSERFFQNLAPPEVPWRIRVFSPLGTASARQIIPEWVRGIQIPRRNPILGIQDQALRIIVAARGALFEADDRWRDYAPKHLGGSLVFRAKEMRDLNVLLPRQGDRVEYPSAAGARLTIARLSGSLIYLDAWLAPIHTGEFQTILWLGDPRTNPSSDPSQHLFQYVTRLYRGRPQLGVLSDALSEGTGAAPEKHLFLATCDQAVPAEDWTHVRWAIRASDAGTILLEPYCFINGNLVGSHVSARELGRTAPEWIGTSTIGTPGGDGRILIGVAHDFVLAPEDSGTFTLDEHNGQNLRSDYVQGLIHAFGGYLRSIEVSREPDASPGSAPPNFNPLEIAYSEPLFSALAAPEGVGHKTYDSAGGQYGVIHAHPFVSLFHEFGRSERITSFAVFQPRVFAANGGRPAYVGPSLPGQVDAPQAKHAGVLPPTTAPDYTIERHPLWVQNFMPPGGNPEDDTVRADAGTPPAEVPVYHFDTHGNAFLRQDFHLDMEWEAEDYIAFKCYWRPRDTGGRQLLYSNKRGRKSGSFFVDQVDGNLRIGWWDTALKSEEWIETRGYPVFEAGSWHYVKVRKRFPRLAENCWKDSVYGATAGEANDLCVVRRFHKASLAVWRLPTIFARCAGAHPGGVSAGTRNAISFTADQDANIPGSTATGLVSNSTRTFSATPATNRITADTGTPFHEDMAGLYWQWGDTPPILSNPAVVGELYRIVDVDPAGTWIDVVLAADGSIPSFSISAGKTGGVFSGIRMVRSSRFAEANHPGRDQNPIEVFGSIIAADPLADVTPTNGEFDGFAYVAVAGPTATNPDIFESGVALPDDIEIGSDAFDNPIYVNPGPGQLHCDAGFGFTCVHTRPYAGAPLASTEPNQELVVAQKPEASAMAGAMRWEFIEERQLLLGRRKVRVAFRDVDQAETSNPGPPAYLAGDGEDRDNRSNQARIILTKIPVSRERGNIERWIYMTLAGGEIFHLVAKLKDNRSSSLAIFKTEDQIRQGDVLRFDSSAPPDCRIVAVSQNVMAYGGLPEQPDGVVFSRPYQPVAVPYSNLFVLSSGPQEGSLGRAGEWVSGMRDFQGDLLMFKRDGVWRAKLRQGLAGYEQITGDDGDGGCVAHASIRNIGQMLIWLGDRGLYAYRGYDEPAWIAHNLEEFFTGPGGVDRSQLSRAAAAINRTRNQYVLVLKGAGLRRTAQRISTEFDHESAGSAVPTKLPAFFRYSRYEEPSLTQIASVQRRGGGVRHLIGGTEDGFLVWMEREDTLGLLVDGSDVWGSQALTVEGLANSLEIPVAGTVDLTHAGPRSCVARWLDSSGAEQSQVVLFAEPGETVTVLHMDRTAPSIPAAGTQITLGAQLPAWESAWLDLGSPWQNKRGMYLDCTCKPLAATLRVEILTDFSELAAPAAVASVNMAPGYFQVSLSGHQGRFFKFRFLARTPTIGQDFELTELTIRHEEADPH